MFKHLTAAVACFGLLMPVAAFSPSANANEYPAPPTDYAPPEDGYPEPVPPPPAGRYDGSPPPRSYKDDDGPPPVRRTAQCLSKPGLRAALNEQGWHAFDHVDYRGDVAVMSAENHRGRRFEVKFDACSGEVLKARPVDVYVERELPPPPVYYRDRDFEYRDYGYRRFGPPRPRIGFYGGPRYGGYHHHRYRHWR